MSSIPAFSDELTRREFERHLRAGKSKLSSEDAARALFRLGLPLTCETERIGQLGREFDFEAFRDAAFRRYLVLKQTFEQLDANHDGFIDKSELVAGLSRLQPETPGAISAQRIMQRLDIDGDGRISWKEWTSVLCEARVSAFEWEVVNYSKDACMDVGDKTQTCMIISDEDTAPVEEEASVLTIDYVQAKKYIVAGGIAGGVSRTFTAPLDRLKTLMQFQAAEVHGKGDSGILHGVRQIWAEGGASAFWKGNGTSVLKIVPESACKFVVYETAKKAIVKDKNNVRAHERFLAGGLAGLTSQALIFPLETIKARIQVSKKGQFRGTLHCAQTLLQQEGVRGFFRGIGPSLVGVMPYAGIDLSVYGSMRAAYVKYVRDSHVGVEEVRPPPYIMLAMGASSSMLAQLCTFPLGLARTVMQTSNMHSTAPAVAADSAMAVASTSTPTGMNAMQTLRHIYKCNGFRGLYAGLTPNCLKVLPAASLSMTIYEYVCRYLERDGGI